ncbi:hypothetical protein ACM16X_19970 [Haloarcula japonica]|uniref:hypothetical protein n=1 Tax=Haloarcula japonica TaxID=29282 RepID=UPI0039F70845
MANIIEWLQDNNEKALLLVYFGLILGLSIPVAKMVEQGYANGNLVRSVVRLQLLVGITQVSVIGLGFFLGLLVLMTVDHKKRIQAMLLWIGVLISLVIITAQGFGPGPSDIANNIVWLLGSLLAGFIFGGGTKLFDTDELQTLEFRRAAESIYFLLLIVVGLTFLEYHIQYPEIFAVSSSGVVIQSIEGLSVSLNRTNLVSNTVTSGLFLLVVSRFIQYDANKDFFILGAPASGKSLFLIGAYLEALGRFQSGDDKTPLNPSEDLISMIEALDRQTEGWIVEATGRGELNTLEFQYVQGSVFPTNIKLSGNDYAGEYLDRLPDAITGATDEEDMDTTLTRLSEGVKEADTLLLMIDCERFTNDEPLDISPYFSILQAADDKEVMLIATKADNLADEFEEQQGLEPHQYFDEFQDYVNQRLRQNENISALLAQTGNTEILPVYYQTTTNEQGNKIPMRDQGSVLTVGFGRLLDRLGRN